MMQAVLPSRPFSSDARQQEAVCAIAAAILFAFGLRGLTYPFSKATDWRLPLRPVFDPHSPGDQPFSAGLLRLAYPLANTKERRA